MRKATEPRRVGRYLAGACLLCLGVIASERPAPGVAQEALSRPADPRAVFKPFLEQVKAYVELRKRQESGLPSLKTTDQPEKLQERRVLLAKKIQQARGGAKRGDVFAGSEQAFRQQIGSAFSGSQGRSLK